MWPCVFAVQVKHLKIPNKMEDTLAKDAQQALNVTGEEMAHARLWAAIDRKIFAPLLRLDAEEEPGEGPAPPAGAAQPPPASGGAAPGPVAETPASAAAIFAEIDADHSGALSFEEFRRWWSDRQAATTGHVDEAVLAKGEELFAQKDADGNGVLSLAEFSAVLSALAGDEWAEAVDPSSGKMYWYSRTTKETRWRMPAPDVDGFVQAAGVLGGAAAPEPQAEQVVEEELPPPRRQAPLRAPPALESLNPLAASGMDVEAPQRRPPPTIPRTGRAGLATVAAAGGGMRPPEQQRGMRPPGGGGGAGAAASTHI